MDEERFRWIALVIGVLALIAAGAALYLALDANDSKASQEQLDQVSADLAQATGAQSENEKALARQQRAERRKTVRQERKLNQGQGRVERAESKQAKANKATAAKLDKLEAKVRRLNQTQTDEAANVDSLDRTVKKLQREVNELSKLVTKLEKKV